MLEANIHFLIYEYILYCFFVKRLLGSYDIGLIKSGLLLNKHI